MAMLNDETVLQLTHLITLTHGCVNGGDCSIVSIPHSINPWLC